MTTKAFFFNRNAAGGYDPALLTINSVTRDGQGTGSIVVTLPDGQTVTLATEYDPGQILAGATFYATIEPGNRSALIPYKQVYAEPAYAAVAKEGADELRGQVEGRITQLRDLLRNLKASAVPSPQLLASAKGTIQMLFPSAVADVVGVVPARRVHLTQDRAQKHRNRAWRVELRAPGKLGSRPLVMDAFRDTGAQIACITPTKARELALPEVGLVDISGITSVPQRLPRVKVHVTLPKYGVAKEVDAAVISDLVTRCGHEFLVDDDLSADAEDAMGVL